MVNVGCLRSCFAILSGRVADDALHVVVGSWGFEYASRFEVDSRPGSHWEASSGRAGAFAFALSRGFHPTSGGVSEGGAVSVSRRRLFEPGVVVISFSVSVVRSIFDALG